VFQPRLLLDPSPAVDKRIPSSPAVNVVTTSPVEAAMVAVSFARVMVGLVLFVAGFAKLRGGERRFTEVVARYELVPAAVAPVLGRWLPWAEVVTGVFLVAGVWSRPAAIAAAALFSVFSLAIGVGLARGHTHDCGCAGPLGGRLHWRLMHRNLALTVAIVPVYAFGGGSLGIATDLGGIASSWSDAGLLALVSLTAVAAAGTFALQGAATAREKESEVAA
jgi:uncharacterized membrane protein YphA (DoxX/SURF4 family)